MARISPTLRTLLESGAVVFCSTDAKKIESYKRREPLKWLLRQSDGSTVAVTTTIERMSQRAGAGLSFDARAMKKVARGVTQVHLTVASAAPAMLTPDHKVLVSDKFKSVKDLRAGDKVSGSTVTKVIDSAGSGAVVPAVKAAAAPKTPPSPKDFDVITLFDVRLPLVGRLEVKDCTSKVPIVQFSLRLSGKDDLAAFEKIRERLVSRNPVPVAHPILTVNGIDTILFFRRGAVIPHGVNLSPGVFSVELEGYGQKTVAAPKPAPKRKTTAAVKASTAKDSAAAVKATNYALLNGSKATSAPVKEAAATTPLKDATSPRAHVIFLVDRSSSMDLDRRTVLAEQQIKTIVAELSPDYLIDVYDFSWETKLQQLQRPAKDFKLSTPANSGMTSLYVALEKGLTSALGYVQTGASVLLYLLTDGENNGPVIDVSTKVKQLLDTDKATIAAIGPKSALQFLLKQGVPEGCILDWQGSGDALKAATVKAAAGAKAFTQAVKEKKSSSLKTFFVDVVATALTVAALKKELRDITPSLLRRKLAKYEVCKPFVTESLKKDYVPGAAYYQLQKKETLKSGRRIIIQPRDEDCFYAGPKARQLLGLPSDGDVTIEPKNLGDFVVYVQSAAENRKLLPGTLFLYDLSHVDGATSPTWSK